MKRLRIGALAALVLLACGAAKAASRVVLFTDGRTLEVTEARREAEMAVLTLEGGATIAVPSSRVANWAELGRALPPEPPAPRTRTPGAATTEWRERAGPFADMIRHAAERHGLDPVLLTAMAEVESSFDPAAVSHKGARGLLQLMPETAERFGVEDAFDASQNVDGGARYLRWLLERYDGRTELALAGYNAGEAAVDKYQGIPPYRETRDYVERVMASVNRLSVRDRETPVAPRAAVRPRRR
jgi:soluble lytic murein transglycosylase-like protein